MSSLPLQILWNLGEDLDTILSGEYDDDFGYGGRPYQLQQSNYYQPQYRLSGPPGRFNLRDRRRKQVKTQSVVGKEAFQVCMDAQQFKPNELTVKVVDNCIVIEGNHEEREDEHGSISRHFVRRYVLPKGYDPGQATSSLSSDGILVVKVPKPIKSDERNVRVVPIQQIGPARLSVKENAQEGSNEDGDGDKKE